MVFFDEANCAICTKTIALNKFKIANNEYVCSECLQKCGFSGKTQIHALTSSQIKTAMVEREQSTNLSASFVATKSVGSYLEVDELKKLWKVPSLFGNSKIHRFSDILDFELIEDGSSISSGGLGRALVGGGSIRWSRCCCWWGHR